MYLTSSRAWHYDNDKLSLVHCKSINRKHIQLLAPELHTEAGTTFKIVHNLGAFDSLVCPLPAV